LDKVQLRDDLVGGKALAWHLLLFLSKVEFSFSTWTRNNRARQFKYQSSPAGQKQEMLAGAACQQ
jgi:hypothetical protein